jgi:hypothetical protein
LETSIQPSFCHHKPSLFLRSPRCDDPKTAVWPSPKKKSKKIAYQSFETMSSDSERPQWDDGTDAADWLKAREDAIQKLLTICAS